MPIELKGRGRVNSAGEYNASGWNLLSNAYKLKSILMTHIYRNFAYEWVFWMFSLIVYDIL